ncbi:MAG: glucan 1,4-alpha-glucosidase [Anaerolineales bacterium]
MIGEQVAPGAPGIPPRWTSSAKTGVGTALNHSSRVWFTLSHGIFDELYYPRVDQACTRDMGMIVTDGQDFFSEEKRQTHQRVEMLSDGVPAYKLTNTCLDGRYRIEKEIVTDPHRDVVLQQTKFTPLKGSLEDYHLYVLLSPHLGNEGANNTGWLGDYKGVPMLFAQRESICLALACSAPWLKCSVGFVGVSDGWQDLSQHKQLLWSYPRAENGNVALTAEIDLTGSKGNFTLALGFGLTPSEAGQRALASLLDGFESARSIYIREWQNWLSMLTPLTLKDADKEMGNLYKISAAVMRTHESKRFPGGLIASLSIPWGFAKSDDDLGGYHLSWPRDLVESAGGLLAVGAHADARRVLYYLQVTQEGDGHWPQNMWLDGSSYWGGIQMDETAFPILLVDLARRENALGKDDLTRLWLMVRKAASFLVCNGPVTQQDRWEEDPGYSPFTLAAEIAALLVAAELADLNKEPAAASYLRETADAWNDNIERWIYVSGTDLANQIGVDGYYVRVAPPEVADSASPAGGFVPIKNRPPSQSLELSSQIISPDALALVRFGLRAADDPRIVNTVRVIDALLKTDTPNGPIWHRYNDDGYGEHEDGSPFDGTGMGRAWPLLAGERAHYELAAGHQANAMKFLNAFESFANEGGLLPEQVWDSPDIAEKELFFGKPSGSAMPLVWAHAEYVKLLRSLHEDHVFDMPSQTVQRYITSKSVSPYALWRFNHKIRIMQKGMILRVEAMTEGVVHWSTDHWSTVKDTRMNDSHFGMYYVDLPTQRLSSGDEVQFTFYWSQSNRWEGINFDVQVSES